MRTTMQHPSRSTQAQLPPKPRPRQEETAKVRHPLGLPVFPVETSVADLDVEADQVQARERPHDPVPSKKHPYMLRMSQAS